MSVFGGRHMEESQIRVDDPFAEQPVPLARLQHVRKSFVSGGKRAEILSDINIDVAPGEFLSIIGPSGSGKSTLLNLLAGIDRPRSGTVSYYGRPVTGVSSSIAYLTQHDSLLPWRTVADNIAVPLEIRKMPAAERCRAVED